MCFSPVAVDYQNAINVVATHRPAETLGRSLILNGHIDVVPEGPLDMWSRSPFDPHLDGDHIDGVLIIGRDRGEPRMMADFLDIDGPALDRIAAFAQRPGIRLGALGPPYCPERKEPE